MPMPVNTGMGVPVMPGRMAVHDIAFDDQNRVQQSYQYRPGFGGVLQPWTLGAWHLLGHAGAIEGLVVADYATSRQLRTQANGRPAIIQVNSITYMSQ